MNNTFNIGAMDTVYPFIPMYPNGQPQGDFLGVKLFPFLYSPFF